MKAVQKFTPEYLESCKEMKTQDIISFLEDFRALHAGKDLEGSKLISMKVPKVLLRAFRAKAEMMGVPYQTQIKALMEKWLQGE